MSVMSSLFRTSNLFKSSKRVAASMPAIAAALANLAAPNLALARSNATLTPIKHVIVIIGENRSFDHVFATYVPKDTNDKVDNLLSKGIVKADGTPGPNYSKAVQQQGLDTDKFRLTPQSKSVYSTLPIAYVGGPATPYVCSEVAATGESCVTQANLVFASAIENGLAPDYVQYLLTGGTGQSGKVPDARIFYQGQGAGSLPPGPYQLTQSTHAPFYPYDSYSPSPVHRFYQMWQQLGCDASKANASNGWGCAYDQAAWVERTVGAGSNGAAEPGYLGEGSTALGFYNVQQGDAPYFKFLADTYSMSDNYHQGVQGGTGANHIVIGYADAIWFSDGNGHPQTPPSNPVDPNNPGTPPNGVSALSEIENPNPMAGTNNLYTQDGYGGGSGSPTAMAPKANYGGGSYVGCADENQPGVSAVTNYLSSLRNRVDPHCEPGRFYLVNNYNPGYFGNGSNAYTDKNASNTVYTIPPTNVKNIGQALSEKNISWAYFGDQWDEYLEDPYQANYGTTDNYCNICNWAQYSSAIMTDAKQRATHLLDTADLYREIEEGAGLPAVSYVKPSGYVDGHPASSKLILFEGFVKKIVDDVKASPYWADTAILVTFDEGGGYWDSGYVQPVDFFGDGTRIPMIAISKFSQGGHISHSYTDHVSIAKFIEANWGIRPLTNRSRDNLPNPLTGSNPYVPINSPAIGDLMDLFNFDQ